MSRPPTTPQSRRERRAAARLDRPQRDRGQHRRSVRPVWRSPVALVSIAAVLIGIVVILFALPKSPTTGEELRAAPVAYPADLTDGEVLGAAQAPVVIELYSDFQCPACRLFVTEQLPRLVTEFVTPGTVRIHARDIAFLGRGNPDESLELAAGAACAADQDRYWQFHDLVFWNQGRENRGDHDAAFIASVAAAAGLDRAGWDACFARGDVRQTIESATQVALGKGISSTPTLIVNGESIVGVPRYDDLAALIRRLAGAASPAPAASFESPAS